MPDRPFTIFALLYGDHFDLATRCLLSIVQRLPMECYELRVGMNEVCEETARFVEDLWRIHDFPERNLYEYACNRNKYPVMRDMFHDPQNPITTPYVMWFDDDSYLRGPNGQPWVSRLVDKLQNTQAAMAGAIYYLGVQGNQRQWVADQPWYNSKPVGNRFKFVTGGWWCIRTQLLREYDWPAPSLNHRGGDVMLGELCRQHDLRLMQFTNEVAINADGQGRQCKAKRRGTDHKPIGIDYQPGKGEKPKPSTLYEGLI